MLNSLKQEIAGFEKKAGFDKTSADELVQMLRKEIKILENDANNENKIVDVIVLALQLANRYDLDLDEEWVAHFKRSQKYLKK